MTLSTGSATSCVSTKAGPFPSSFSRRSASRWRFVAAAAGHGDPAGAGRADRRKRHRLWPIWAAAAAGAFFGDWLSYWIGYHYQDRVAHMWPLSRNPQLLARATRSLNAGACWASSSAAFRPAARRGAAGGRHLRHAAALFPVSQRHVGDDLGVRHSGAGAFGIKWLSQWLG